jgi:uncharacterized membrane-anchored protein YhcB (DUF1043 family)
MRFSKTLIKQKAELDALTTQITDRPDLLEQSMSLNESLQKSAELLDAMLKSTQEVIDAFATFKTEQEKGNEVVNSKMKWTVE